jgi:hypothetical protein
MTLACWSLARASSLDHLAQDDALDRRRGRDLRVAEGATAGERRDAGEGCSASGAGIGRHVTVKP